MWWCCGADMVDGEVEVVKWVCVGGVRGQGGGAATTHSVAGCEGALHRLHGREGLDVNTWIRFHR